MGTEKFQLFEITVMWDPSMRRKDEKAVHQDY